MPGDTNSSGSVPQSLPVNPAQDPILQPPGPYKLRSMLEDLVVKDLLGPAGGPEEELPPFEDRVNERYLVGMLAPKKVVLDPLLFDDITVAGTDSPEEGKPEIPAVQSATMFPSSMGLTFAVDLDAKALRITARWGHYKKIKSNVYEKKETGDPELTWKREQVEGATQEPIPLKEGFIDPWVVSKNYPQVTVTGKIRHNATHWIVTLFLVNGQLEPQINKDGAWLFQPELIVESQDKGPVFVKRMNQSVDLGKMDSIAKTETQAMAMLYRWQVEFAVGHSVGVHAVLAEGDPQRAVRISTSVMPSCEVPKNTPPMVIDNPDLGNVTLDMKTLSELDDKALADSLKTLADAYEKWINRENGRKSDPAQRLAEHKSAVDEALSRCKTSLARIREGIDTIATKPEAAESFRFANRAMWKQRVRSIIAKQVRKGERIQDAPDTDIDVVGNRSWYPFQLAFILLNLASATNLHHQDRSHETDAICDLL